MYEVITSRRSVRGYDGRAIGEADYRGVQEACAHLPAAACGVRVVPVECPSREVFTGLVIKEAPAFLGVVGAVDRPGAEVWAGYAGEFVVLSATALGLGTCWVTATYRPDRAAALVGVGPGERLLAVSPLGYPGRVGLVEDFFNVAITRSRQRKPLEELIDPSGLSLDAAPAWTRTALEAARLAPSAVNRQPWRFTLAADGITVSIAPGGKEVPSAPRAMDCGMAMLHLELAARAAGVTGTWKLLPAPGVARFRV